MKNRIKLFSTIKQTDIEISALIKFRENAIESNLISTSIQPCIMEINRTNENILCASKTPAKSDDIFLSAIEDIFKNGTTIDILDKFKNSWKLSCDNYSQLKLDYPDPINVKNYIIFPREYRLSLEVESVDLLDEKWKADCKTWDSTNNISQSQFYNAIQFYQSLQPSFDSDLRKVNFRLNILYVYQIYHKALPSFYPPKLTRVQIRMLEIWGEQTGDKISRGVNAISKKDQGRLSSSLSSLANSSKGIQKQKLKDGKFQQATWGLDKETYHACNPDDKLLSPSAIKACKERAHEFKRMKLF